MEAAGALASLAPSPITVLGLIPLLALGITYFRYQQYDPESYITDINTVSRANYFQHERRFLFSRFDHLISLIKQASLLFEAPNIIIRTH